MAVQRRYKTSDISTTFITMKKDQTSITKPYYKNYPLFAALGSGLCFAGFVFISMIANSPDVKIVNAKKHATIRKWGLRP